MDSQANDRNRGFVAHIVVMMPSPTITELGEQVQGLQRKDHDLFYPTSVINELKTIGPQNNFRWRDDRENTLDLGNANLVVIPAWCGLEVPAVPLGIPDA